MAEEIVLEVVTAVVEVSTSNASTLLAAHVAAADPHPGYLLESAAGATGLEVLAATTPAEGRDALEITAANIGAAGTTIGAYSDVPASPSTGHLHIVELSGIVRRWSGSAWVDILPGLGRLYPPPTSGWSKTAGSHVDGAITAVDGHIRIDLPVTGVAARLYAYRAEPAATYTIDMLVRGQLWGDGFVTHLIVIGGWYDTVSKKATFVYLRTDGQLFVQRDSEWGVSFFSNPLPIQWRPLLALTSHVFTRTVRTATDLVLYVSHDGRKWHQLYTEAVGAFLTPDSVIVPGGVSLSSTASVGATFDLLSFNPT